MRKFKKLVSKAVAFSMATVLACSGFLSGFMGEAFKPLTAQAATVLGTVGADTFSWDNATVYFLLTDRFRNGDTSNDHSYGRGLDANGNVADIKDTRGTFHGGDFVGITQAIKEGYFNDLGVNALWISAPYEQIHGYIIGNDDDPSFVHYSYHGYYVLDYTNTDANFGTEEEFRELVDTAHEYGLRVVLDVVLNHAGYNSMYDMNEYGFGVLKDGWKDCYYNYNNVSNPKYHGFIDYTSGESQWQRWWGSSWLRAGLPGYTAGGSNETTQLVAGLPDFKTESSATVGIPTFLAEKWKKEGRYDEEVSELKNYLNKNGYAMTVTNCISYWLSRWVREYGVDGFRCDTAKHVERSAWAVVHDMCTKALKEWKAENPDKKLDDLEFWMTGEAWDHGVSYDDYYTVGKFDSMINFDTTGGGVLALGKVAGKYEDYAAAVNNKADFNILSYMSSHDTTIARGDMKYLGSALLMLPGGVQIYYGDETDRPAASGFSFDGNGGAGHSLRSDMNWDNYDEDVLAHWQKVGTFRNNHIAVGAGAHTTVSATSGVGFTRTYSKNGISDRIAAVIGASANASVTIDVSGVWADGSVVTNYYDNSSATVVGGKVTFNAGANGTILIGDPDGKPLVSVTGEARFKGTQKVTINVDDADYAIVSIDGGKKFIAYDGDTFEIGGTAYEGDTVAITYKAVNSKGTIDGKATFYKVKANEEIIIPVTPGKIKVKMADGSAPYVYAWEESGTALAGVWPGTKLTNKDAEGYYYLDLDTMGSYSAVINNGSGAKTDDITGLCGEAKISVASGYGSYEIESGGGVIDPIKNPITIRVKPYSASSPAPYLYVWTDKGSLNGGFPGKQLTEKDENGNYVFVVEGQKSVNCIVGGGSNQAQSGNLTGITGEALIKVESADYSKCTIEKTEAPESKFTLMKKEAREIKNMTSSDYTTATWNKLYSYVAGADKLVAKGEDKADANEVTAMYNNIVAAKKALVLAAPKVTNATSGSKVVKGTAACEAEVKVTVGGKTYTAIADEVTGVWTITASSNLTSSSTIKMTATRNGLASVEATYNMGDPVSTLSATAKASATKVAVDGKITITATATGGTAPYTYTYVVYNNETGASSELKTNTKSNTYTWTAGKAGTRVFYVDVTDATGKTVRTTGVTVTVSEKNVELSATSKASASKVSVGEKVTFTANAVGGTGSYKYSYIVYNKDTGKWARLKDMSTSNTYTWTAGSAGTRVFYVDVTDASGNTVRCSALTVKTVANELKVTAKASAKNVSVDGEVTFTATATGGQGSYKYSYIVYNKDTGKWARLADKVSSNTYTWKAKSEGTREFYVDVTDASGNIVRSSVMTVVTEKTEPLMAVASATSSKISVGDSVTIVGTAINGTEPYTYSFIVYNKATNSWHRYEFSSSNILTWKAKSAGTREFYVEAKDAKGNVVRSSAVTITVK